MIQFKQKNYGLISSTLYLINTKTIIGLWGNNILKKLGKSIHILKEFKIYQLFILEELNCFKMKFIKS